MVETMRKIGELIDQNKILEQQNEELRKIIEINLSQKNTSNTVSFIDIIDINEVENLLIKFYQFNKIPTAIYDPNSKLLFSVGWKPVCVKFHHCRIGSKDRCSESIQYINQKISDKPYVYFQCKNGLNSIAIPITIRDTHIATLVLSQFLYEGEKIDYDFLRQQAETFKFDEKKYIEATENLPVFSSAEIEQITNNVTYLAELIAYLGFKNIETHEKTEKHLENELILSALRDKVTEQENLLKSIFQNIVNHQNELQENTISKVDQAKELEKINLKLERSETILNSLLTSLPLGICFVRKGVFTYVNDQLFKITGHTPKELIGRSPEFLFGTESGCHELFNYSPDYHFIKSNTSIELSLKTKDNRMIDIIAFSSLIDKTNPKHGWTISILDISAMKEVQNELIIAKEKAEESDRLKNAFLTNMSHELRTPMNAILGFAELLSSSEIDGIKKKEYFQIIRRSGKKLLRLIDDIIDVSKIATNQLELNKRTFSLHQVLIDLKGIYTEYISNKCGDGVELLLKEPVNRQYDALYSDDIRLKQVFCNLLSNALKFTLKGTIEYGYEVKDNNIEFFVRDSGQGIKKNQIVYIFDRFRQGDSLYTRKHGGAGIGLTISKSLVELMGGKIWVESKFGKGSTFYFTLPVERIQPNLATKDTDFSPFNLPFDWSKKTILIAEDEEVNFLYLQHLLMPTNIKIRWAKNGQKAIDFINQDPDIDLVLMDIKMPVLNGLDATKMIKSQKTNMPIIAQTAYAHGHSREDFIQAGCDEYIPKPINSKHFITLLEKFLNKN